MSHALQACILIQLDASESEDVQLNVAALASKLGVAPEMVRKELETLESFGQVQTVRIAPDGLIDGAMIVRKYAGVCE